jgi:hypothetical protein
MPRLYDGEYVHVDSLDAMKHAWKAISACVHNRQVQWPRLKRGLGRAKKRKSISKVNKRTASAQVADIQPGSPQSRCLAPMS